MHSVRALGLFHHPVTKARRIEGFAATARDPWSRAMNGAEFIARPGTAAHPRQTPRCSVGRTDRSQSTTTEKDRRASGVLDRLPPRGGTGQSRTPRRRGRWALGHHHGWLQACSSFGRSVRVRGRCPRGRSGHAPATRKKDGSTPRACPTHPVADVHQPLLTPQPGGWAVSFGRAAHSARVSACGRDRTPVFGQIGVEGQWTQVSLAFVMLAPPIMCRAGGTCVGG